MSWIRACLQPLLIGLERGRRDSLLRNSFFIMATTLLTSALGFAFWTTVAHLYHARVVGLAAALLSAMMLTAICSTFGIQATLVHRLPQRRSEAEWSATVIASLTVAGVTSIVGAFLVIVCLPLVSERFEDIRAEPVLAALFAVGVVFTTLSIVLDYVFIAERASGAMLVRNGIFSLAKIPLAAVPPLFFSAGVVGILGSWVIALTIGIAVSFALLLRFRRVIRVASKGILGEIRALVPALPAQHAINIAASLPMFALPLLVAARLSVTETAHFYTTWMVGSFFFVISPAVSWALFAEGRTGGTDLGAAARRSALFTGGLLVPLMLAFMLGAHPILSLFGPGYAAHGVLLLRILILSAIPDAVTNLFVSVMRVRGRLLPAALLNSGMAVETLVLAWVLLPGLGLAGAGWAWLIAQLTGSLFVAAYVVRWRASENAVLRSLVTSNSDGIAALTEEPGSLPKLAGVGAWARLIAPARSRRGAKRGEW
jgi:O-antigen/teichoic acid export membrane protein